MLGKSIHAGKTHCPTLHGAAVNPITGKGATNKGPR
jgi:hypothetical protein